MIHQLLRLEVLGRSHLDGPNSPVVNGGAFRRAHCSCGSTAFIRAGQGHLWITLHRAYPDEWPAQLATGFGIS